MKLSTILLAAFVCTAFTFAQAADAAKPAAPKHAAKSQLAVSGTITSVDAIGNVLIVKAKKAEDTVNVDTTTVIKAGGKKVTLAELITGSPVTVNYKMSEGKKIAVKIMEKVAAPKAAKTETPKAETK